MTPSQRQCIVGLGEVLWDMLPQGSRLGGAPANFTVHAASLGADAVLASAVGDDKLGIEARDQLESKKIDLRWLQTAQEATSRVLVALDEHGHATYTIEAPVAWDALAFTPEWHALAQCADAVCFGSLGQRDPRSRITLHKFVEATPPACLRIFDVNLRPPFWDELSVTWGLKHATVVKVNEHELPILAAIRGVTAGLDESAAARGLLETLPDAAAICVTLGERGSLLVLRDRTVAHAGFPTQVVDTIGAGDSFTAALAWYWLRGAQPEGILAAANRMGSYVASQSGAMPTLPDSLRAELDALAGV